MEKTEAVKEHIMNVFDKQVAPLTRADYIEVMESLIDDIESRLEAAKHELEDEENGSM
jgi:hypothetical protein